MFDMPSLLCCMATCNVLYTYANFYMLHVNIIRPITTKILTINQQKLWLESVLSRCQLPYLFLQAKPNATVTAPTP